MLHKIFPILADQLATIPGIGTIDLDQAQLDFMDAEYPVAYPAVFIDIDEVQWMERAAGIQRGIATLRFTVACEVFGDTGPGQSQRSAAMAKLNTVTQVHQKLNHFFANEAGGEAIFGPMVRTATRRDRPQHPEARCQALFYKCEVTDADAGVGLPTQLLPGPIAMTEEPVAAPASPVVVEVGNIILV